MKSKLICKFYISIMFLLDFLEVVIWKITTNFFATLQNYFEIVVICKKSNKLIYVKYLI